MPNPVPTPAQLQFLDWELGLFLHFGIRTFYEGHRDWDGVAMAPEQFNPVGLDCDQWMAVAREAGVRYAVMTAKHHDGFALWPSQYTDFSVANSTWREGRGDVVREFVAAARRHGIEPGLYYSPAQWGTHGVEMDDPAAYDDYFVNQLTELLTGYGELRVLWLDGCGSSEHDYDWRRIFGEIRRLQPTVLVAHLGDPDFGWIGNECGLAPRPVWNAVEAVPHQNEKTVIETAPRARFLPMECDCMMRERNWFFEQGDRFTVKSLPELMGMYDYSVGRGANLLVNIGPDRRGLLPDDDANRLLEFGEGLRTSRRRRPMGGGSGFANRPSRLR
jgi:alpha-L-fucosidase